MENKIEVEDSKTENHKFNVVPVPESEVVNFGTANKCICYICSKPFGVYEIPSYCPHCGEKQDAKIVMADEIERSIIAHIGYVMPPDLKGVDPAFVEDDFPGYELSFMWATAALIASEGEIGDPGVEKVTVPFIRELAGKLIGISGEEIVVVGDLLAIYADLISQVLTTGRKESAADVPIETPIVHIAVHEEDLELLHNTLMYIKRYIDEIGHEVPLKDRSTKLEHVITLVRERLETIGKYYKHE